ncbi:MAG: tRNA uridine-5-carboxymethylaminomethyl(34) synthesis GTPase MnmE [bacterium]|nr:tRNA uridine-5-carboxymethylaminomethyl(34) synthesis GTPase MnmE [bacterium]
MPLNMLNDTIAAISTPVGEGGIGIIRLSGQKAIEIAEKIFEGKDRVSNFLTHTIHYGRIIDPTTSEILDTVLLSIMLAPKTYTCEDIVEINAHGGIIQLNRILETVLSSGARLAQPGEFTKRAFLNGRIDLSQAEAVVELIRAKTDLSAKFALSQLTGSLYQQISSLRQTIISLLAELEVSIDFYEEDIELITLEEVQQRLNKISLEIKKLIETAKYGRILQQGVITTIVGRPNVGKSSLLNTLVGKPRAIVTHVPGTTRDTIEEMIDIEGIPLKVIDTAGLRHTVDIVEEEGVRRAKEALNQADLVIFVIDGSVPLTVDDIRIMEELKAKEAILVINKCDLPSRVNVPEVAKHLPSKPIINLSVTKGSGLNQLKQTIKGIFFAGKLLSTDEIIITNLRHKEALASAFENINSAIKGIGANLSFEFIAIDLRELLDNLGLIVGETVTEDILNEIFSNFCIGK